MTKKNISITIDVEAYEKHRTLGTNISDVCNALLINSGNSPVEIKAAQEAKTKEIVGAVEDLKKKQEGENVLKEKLINARLLKSISLDKSNAYLKLISKEYPQIGWADLVAMMDRA